MHRGLRRCLTTTGRRQFGTSRRGPRAPRPHRKCGLPHSGCLACPCHNGVVPGRNLLRVHLSGPGAVAGLRRSAGLGAGGVARFRARIPGWSDRGRSPCRQQSRSDTPRRAGRPRRGHPAPDRRGAAAVRRGGSGVRVRLGGLLDRRRAERAGLPLAAGAPTLAAAVNVSAFNIENTVGPAVGGVLLSHGLGWRAPMWTASVLVAVTLGLAVWARAIARRPDVAGLSRAGRTLPG
jgi:hypothetical protein